MLTKIDIRGYYRLGTTSVLSETSDVVRFIVYQDKQTNGASASVLNLLETADILSFRNLENKDRFKVLVDDYCEIHHEAGAYDGTNDQFGNMHKSFYFSKKVQIPLEFSSSTPSEQILHPIILELLVYQNKVMQQFNIKLELDLLIK